MKKGHDEASLGKTVTIYLPTDKRVGEESLEQPWLRGIRLRLCPSPASTLWAPELMVLRAVLVSTRPGEPLRLPASERQRNTHYIQRKRFSALLWQQVAFHKKLWRKSSSNVRILRLICACKTTALHLVTLASKSMHIKNRQNTKQTLLYLMSLESGKSHQEHITMTVG